MSLDKYIKALEQAVTVHRQEQQRRLPWPWAYFTSDVWPLVEWYIHIFLPVYLSWRWH